MSTHNFPKWNKFRGQYQSCENNNTIDIDHYKNKQGVQLSPVQTAGTRAQYQQSSLLENLLSPFATSGSPTSWSHHFMWQSKNTHLSWSKTWLTCDNVLYYGGLTRMTGSSWIFAMYPIVLLCTMAHYLLAGWQFLPSNFLQELGSWINRRKG